MPKPETAKSEKSPMNASARPGVWPTPRGMDVTVVLLGKGVAGAAESFGAYGADKVLVADGDDFEPYLTEVHASAIADLAKDAAPAVILIGASAQGKDLSPVLSAKMKAGLSTDCTAFRMDGGKLVATRPMYAGKVFAEEQAKSETHIATPRPNVMEMDDSAARARPWRRSARPSGPR